MCVRAWCVRARACVCSCANIFNRIFQILIYFTLINLFIILYYTVIYIQNDIYILFMNSPF